VQALHRGLGIGTLAELRAAAQEGRIRGLAGFGEKTEERIREALAHEGAGPQRFKLAIAAQYAESLAAHLRKVRGVRQVAVAGSFRRMKDTVGDLDILVAAPQSAPVMDRFTGYDEVREVLARGDTRASVVLKSGVQVDLRLVPEESYGAALHYFTGSKAHNIAVRRLGQARGLKVNEYGVFRGARRVAGATEASVFAAVGLPYIAPELREDRGEIEAAKAGTLPRLVELADLRGDLHVHTKASDGRDTLRDMALAARERKLAYIAVTEHSRRLAMARGLDSARLAKQIDEIAGLNATLDGVTVLAGIEVDVLEDGTLDLPDSILRRLDIVVAAVHGQFELPQRRQTDRLLRALDNRYVRVLAHPTGRLIGVREPMRADWVKVVRRARGAGVALELNAQPDRLDADDALAQTAREEGALVAVSSDAHSRYDYDFLRYGIGQARRGWLEPKDVVNTRPLAELRAWLKR
jgi:DNA polymerase (family 10)